MLSQTHLSWKIGAALREQSCLRLRRFADAIAAAFENRRRWLTRKLPGSYSNGICISSAMEMSWKRGRNQWWSPLRSWCPLLRCRSRDHPRTSREYWHRNCDWHLHRLQSNFRSPPLLQAYLSVPFLNQRETDILFLRHNYHCCYNKIRWSLLV